MKKMMIKLFLLLVAVTLMPVMPVIAEAETEDLSSQARKLAMLGMLSPEIQTDTGRTFSRGEFAKEFLYYMGKGDSVPKATSEYYYDVPRTHEYASYINYITDLGYVKQDIGKLYYPERNITCSEAGLVFVSAMGLDIIESSNQTAYSKLMKGVSGYENAMTGYDFIKMAYNALDIETYVMNEVTDANVSYSLAGTFLETYFEIYEYDGRITATEVTSLYQDTETYPGSVTIGDKSFIISAQAGNINEYLGYYVTAYYKLNNDREEELVYFENKKTEEVVIGAGDFISIDGNTIKYNTPDNLRTKRVTFKNNSVVIFNDVRMDIYDESIFDIENGSIELVGINKDYDVVKIYSYKDIVIAGKSAENMEIYSKYSNEIYCLEEYEKIILRDRYGRNLNIEDVQAEDVASIGISKDKSLIIVNISSQKVEGTLSQSYTDGADNIWIIDNAEYKFSRDYQQKLTPIGVKVTVYLNYEGRICYADIGKNTVWKFGYLIRASVRDQYDGLDIKIFTEESQVTDYITGDKVKIDGEKFDSYDDAIRALSYTRPEDTVPADKAQPQLIQYCLNKDSEIVKIDTARVGANENEESSLDMYIKNTWSKYYSASKRLFGRTDKTTNKNIHASNCLIGNDTKVFVVPNTVEEARTELGAYMYKTGTSYFTNNLNYTIDAYNPDFTKGAMAGVIVVRLDSVVAAPEFNPLENGVIVSGISKTIDSDDAEVWQVKGYSIENGKEVILTDYDKARVLEKNEVEKGDIIRYGLINGNLTGLDVDMDYRNNLNAGYTYAPVNNGNNAYNAFFSRYRISVGYIADVKNGFLFYASSAQEVQKPESCKLIFSLANTNAFEFNRASGKVSKIDAEQLKKYAYNGSEMTKIAAYTADGELRGVVVYN